MKTIIAMDSFKGCLSSPWMQEIRSKRQSFPAIRLTRSRSFRWQTAGEGRSMC